MNHSSTFHETNSNGELTEIQCHTKANFHNITYNWNIDRFDFHKPADGSNINSIISPTFSSPTLEKVGWYLKIQSTYYDYSEFSLYLHRNCKKNETKLPAKFSFSFLDNEGNLLKKYASRLLRNYSDTPCWGESGISKKVLSPDNSLNIVCNIVLCEYKNIAINCNYTDDTLRAECNLLQDFGSLLENSQHSDFVVQLLKNGKKYRTHKAILAARSRVWAAWIKRAEEKGDKVAGFRIKNMDEQILDELLKYIYTGKCENIGKFSTDLLIAAHSFGLDHLKTICIEQIRKSVTVGNAVNTLLLADKYGFAGLKSKMIRFIAANYVKVSNTTDWKRIVQTNSKFVHKVCQVLSNSDLSDKEIAEE